MRKQTRGFTLLELIAVFLLIAILASLLTPFWRNAIASAYRVRCVSNLKNLHTAFEGYIEDHKCWPGQPNFPPDQDIAYENWWLAIMQPYTQSTKIWQCPLLAARKLKEIDGTLLKMHYSPTMFDQNPISPHRWPKQPWIIEIANAHGSGPLILMPDGSVTDFYTLDPMGRVR